MRTDLPLSFINDYKNKILSRYSLLYGNKYIPEIINRLNSLKAVYVTDKLEVTKAFGVSRAINRSCVSCGE